MTKTLEATIVDATHLELSEPISALPGRQIKISLTDEVPADDGSQLSTAASGDGLDPELRGPRRGRELAWCRAHEQVLEAYAGQWIVVEGEELVAHGEDPAAVVGEARSRGIEIPFLMYVEEFHPDVVKMGL